MPSHSVRYVCLAASMLVLITGCQNKENSPPTEVEVQATVAHQASITEHITADAILSPLAQAAISPRISAPVKKFFVQRGSKVKQGELLATLENRDLTASVMDNQGSYDAAEAAYQTATKAQVPEDLQRARLDLAQAKANLDLNRQIVQSRKQLFAAGAIPGRDLDTAQAALVQAQTAFDLAQQRFNAVEQVGHAAALKGAQGQLESAKGKYLGAEATLQYSEIRSPIAGVVTDRPLFAGETAVAGTPLLTVMDTSSLLAKVHLTQSQTQGLKVGDAASVIIPGIENPFAGSLKLISPALDPDSTTVEVWIQVPNADGSLKAGTPVHLSIASRSIPDALVVPSESIVPTSDGKKAVMVIGTDSVAHQKAVTTGIQDNGFVQIRSGLSRGDRVVTQRAYALDDGTRVKVVTAEDDAGKSGESN